MTVSLDLQPPAHSFAMELANSVNRLPADRACVSSSLQALGALKARALMTRFSVHDDSIWLRIHADDAFGKVPRWLHRTWFLRVRNRFARSHLVSGKLIALTGPAGGQGLHPALRDDLCHVILESDRYLSPWQGGKHDAAVCLDTPTMISGALEVCDDHVSRGDVLNLCCPVADAFDDPSLGDALLDSIIKVQLHLQQGCAHHCCDIGVGALLAATSLEMSLNPVTGAPVPQAHNPPKGDGLLDGVLKLHRYTPVHGLREYDADISACASPTIFPDLEVNVGDTPNLDIQVPGPSSVTNPCLGDVLLDVVVENYVDLLLGDGQHGAHVGLRALGTPSVVDFEERVHAISSLETHHLVHPAHRYCLHNLVLEPDSDPSAFQNRFHNAEVCVYRPTLAARIVRVDDVPRREVQVPR
mmetsp:Transcript_32295/g.57903  ORF Transcript_32295/g.57903 Transcript_32295/m.57903 type:complete len:414 (+) Transcript_32295:57-1298(+)